MNNKLETEKQIAKELSRGKSPKEIFKKIKNKADAKSIGQLLYLSGEYQTLLEYSAENIKQNKEVPWSFVISTLSKGKISVAQEDAEILFDAWLINYSKKDSSIYASKKWEQISDKFAKAAKKYKKDINEEFNSKESEMLEKLEFAQAQNLSDEESRIVRMLLTKYPNNPKYKKLQKELEDKNIAKLIKKQKSSIKQYSQPTKKFVPEASTLKKKWSLIINNIKNPSPEDSKNLSLFFAFLDWPDEAIKVLEKNLSDLSSYWIYLEWLIETGQYTASLEVIDQLLVHLQSDPESLLPLNYMKAQSLYYLGQKQEAIEHIKAIIEVNPRYRSAQILLEEWS